MRKSLIGSLFLAVVILGAVPLLQLSLAQAATIPPRQDVVWATGYWRTPDDLKPWDANPVFGIATMYETLFGYNAVDDAVIPVIGTDYAWNAANDSELIVNINTNAKWSDGNAITVDDVVYSYMLAMWNTSNFGGDMKMRLAGGYDQSPTEIGSIEPFKAVLKVTNTQVKFVTNQTFHHTGFLDTWLRANVPILPKSVWTQIFTAQQTANKEIVDFANDWWDPTFNTAWKVCSGPYIPYYRSSTHDIEIYKLRADWWGAGKIHTDLPNGGTPTAPYLGMNHYPSNTLQDTGFLTGAVDWYSGYFDKIWTVFGKYPFINTWYGQKAPYMLGVSSMVELVPNWNYFPNNLLWYRKALAYGIDYVGSSNQAASGYLQRAKQGFVDPIAAPLVGIYNDTIQQQYAIDYNIGYTTNATIDPESAVYWLDQNCYLEANGNVSGTLGQWAWYTKDASAYLGMAKANGGVVADEVADGILPGVNVKLGPYVCISVSGWTDVDKATEMWCAQFTNNLNITMFMSLVDYGTWDSAFKSGSVKYGMMCSSPKLMNYPVVFLNGYRGNNLRGSVFNRNTTNWYGAEADAYEQAFQGFEISPKDSTYYLRNASIMQEMLAKAIPSIPLYGNGFWYAFSNSSWTGWVAEDNDFNQITTTWDNDNFALRTRLVLNLRAVPGAGEFDWTLFFGIVSIGAIAALVIAIIVMRKRGA